MSNNAVCLFFYSKSLSDIKVLQFFILQVLYISKSQNLHVSNDMTDDEFKYHNHRSSQENSVRESIRFWGNFISAWIPVLVIIASIILYIVDVATDLRLAYDYHFKEEYLYFGLTLSFVIIPYLISLIVSGLVYKRRILSTSRCLQRLAWFFYVLTLPISGYSLFFK